MTGKSAIRRLPPGIEGEALLRKATTLCLAALVLAMCGGCATNLQRGHKYFGKGRYAKARRCYENALEEQRLLCVLPAWSGQRFSYKLNAPYAAEAILGIGNTYREEKKCDSAMYNYFYYVQFCLRHGLDCSRQVETIRSYIIENKKGNEDARLEEILQSR